jgi:hypothetical protein
MISDDSCQTEGVHRGGPHAAEMIQFPANRSAEVAVRSPLVDEPVSAMRFEVADIFCQRIADGLIKMVVAPTLILRRYAMFGGASGSGFGSVRSRNSSLHDKFLFDCQVRNGCGVVAQCSGRLAR